MRALRFSLLVCCYFVVALFTGCGRQNVERSKIVENSATSISKQIELEQVDTIKSFFGHHLIMNDSVMQQIEVIVSEDDFLSLEGNVLKTGNVGWGINVSSNNITLFSSVEPDDDQMKEAVKYLSWIYGTPYEDKDEGFDIKWSSSKDPQDIFSPDCTLVHLRSVHTDEGGTFLVFHQ